jgi:hypothetical protein
MQRNRRRKLLVMAVIGKISALEMFGSVKACIVVLPNVLEAALHYPEMRFSYFQIDGASSTTSGPMVTAAAVEMSARWQPPVLTWIRF